MLIASTGSTDTRYFWGYKTSITNITFEDEIDIPVGAFASWDVSELQDGSIMAYIIDDGLGTSTYELFIQTNNDLILANPNSSYLFYDFRKVISINNLSLLNTSIVTNMLAMFHSCDSLINLNLSSFDTSNVTDMASMFLGCSSLTNIDFRSANFSGILYEPWDMFFSVPNGITIIVLDVSAQGFINNALSMSETTGNVIIY